MKAEDAAELMDQEKTEDTLQAARRGGDRDFRDALLAITGLGGQNATKEALNSNIQASNYWNFFQAKNMRQTAYRAGGRRTRTRLAERSGDAAGSEGRAEGEGRGLSQDRRALRVRARDRRGQEGTDRRVPRNTRPSAITR